MNRMAILAIGACGIAAALGAAGARQAPVLAQAKPGLWEIEGIPGTKAPRRECVADLVVLLQFEHRGRTCTRTVLRETDSGTQIEYSCGGAGFGRTEVTVVTPRSLKIDTQGISEGMPFGYVLQARRVADCGTATSGH